MQFYKSIYCIIIFLFLLANVNAQEGKLSDYFAISLEFGAAQPGGDMAERFGWNSVAGTGLYYYLNKSNMQFGVNMNFIFGNQIKEDVISSLRNENLVLLGVDNNYADVLLRQRGFLIDFVASKTIPIKWSNSSSGIELGLGVGIMQHKVRIQVDTRNVPLLLGDAVNGYDQNSLGPSIKQIAGYHWRAMKSNANLSVLLELTEGFTKQTHPLDFNSLEIRDKRRFDVHAALKIAYYLPLYRNKPSEEIFY